MSKSPSFQFYPKDWLSDAKVKVMTFEEKGVYVELLSIYWLEDGLPSDLGRLARLLGLPLKHFAKLWPAILPCFRIDGEKLAQKRIEEEKLKQAAYRQLQSRKGTRSAKSRIANTGDEARLTFGYGLGSIPVQPKFNSSSSSSTSVERTDGTANQPTAPRNPLIGDRSKWERECLSLVGRMAELTGEDGVDVIARASGYEGAKRTKLNPATMTDDRLMNTVLDLRKDVASEEAKLVSKERRLSTAG